MNNNQPQITIKSKRRQRYTSQQLDVATWESRLIERIRQLTRQGDGEFIVRKRGDEVTICRICKPEVVKG